MGKINFAGSITLEPDSWEEFVKYTDSTYKSLAMQFIHTGSGYTIYAIENNLVVYFFIWDKDKSDRPGVDKTQNDSDYDDFVNNYKDDANKEVTVKDEMRDYTGLRTGRMCEKNIQFTTTEGEAVTSSSITFPYNISLIAAKCLADWPEFNKLDSIYAYAKPPNNGVIGSTTASANIGDDTIAVSIECVKSVLPGDFITIGSNTTKREIKDTSTNAKTITLVENLDITVNQEDSVALFIPRCQGCRLLANTVQYFGDKTFGGGYFPVGWSFDFEYHHAVTPTEAYNIYFELVYYHGK